MAAERIEIDVSKALADIAKMKGGLADIKDELKDVNSAGKAAFDSAAKSADNMASGAVQKLLSEVRDLNIAFSVQAATMEKTGKKGLAAANEQRKVVHQLNSEYLILAKTVRQQQSEGITATEDQTAALLDYKKGLQGATVALQDTTTKTSALSTVIKASPIGLLITLVGYIIAKLATFQSVMDKVSQAMAASSAVINLLIDRLVLLGTSIYNAGKAVVLFIKGDFTGALAAGKDSADEARAAFNNLGGAIVDVATNAYTLEGRFHKLMDAQLDATISILRQVEASKKLIAVSEQETNSFDTRIAALKRAIEIEKGVAAQKESFAAQSAALARAVFAASRKEVADKEKLIAAEQVLLEAKSDSVQKQTELIGRLVGIEKQKTEFFLSNLLTIRNAIEKLKAEMQTDPIDAEVQEVRRKYDKLNQVAEEGLRSLAKIEGQRALTDSEIQSRKELSDLIVALVEKQAVDEVNAIQAGLKKLDDVRKKKQADLDAATEEEIDKKRKALEDIREIEQSKIDITEAEFANLIKVLEDGGAKKEEIAKLQFEFDQNIQAQRLRANLEFQKGLLAITAAGDTTQIALIKNNIALLEEQLAGIGTGFGADTPKEPKGILDLLGIDLGLSDAQMRELEQGLSNIKSLFDDVAGAQLDAAEAAVEAAEKNIEAAQKTVDEQKRLNEEGFANNLSEAERNLAAAKEQEQKALEQKRAAQRQQQLIDTAAQVSSLITASAKTLQTFNGPLLPIGIALIAAMFGAFIAAKARAAQASKFRHGGEGRVDGNSIIVGASHDTGGVGIEAEGGEYFGTDGKRFGIVNKRMTAKHFDLIQAINKDDKGRMRKALEALTRPNLRHDDALSAAGSGGSIAIIGGGEDKKAHKLLQKIHDKPSKTITVEGGYVVERNGNYTRRRRIRA